MQSFREEEEGGGSRHTHPMHSLLPLLPPSHLLFSHLFPLPLPYYHSHTFYPFTHTRLYLSVPHYYYFGGTHEFSPSHLPLPLTPLFSLSLSLGCLYLQPYYCVYYVYVDWTGTHYPGHPHAIPFCDVHMVHTHMLCLPCCLPRPLFLYHCCLTCTTHHQLAPSPLLTCLLSTTHLDRDFHTWHTKFCHVPATMPVPLPPSCIHTHVTVSASYSCSLSPHTHCHHLCHLSLPLLFFCLPSLYIQFKLRLSHTTIFFPFSVSLIWRHGTFACALLTLLLSSLSLFLLSLLFPSLWKDTVFDWTKVQFHACWHGTYCLPLELHILHYTTICHATHLHCTHFLSSHIWNRHHILLPCLFYTTHGTFSPYMFTHTYISVFLLFHYTNFPFFTPYISSLIHIFSIYRTFLYIFKIWEALPAYTHM